jgi:hypothetical protein
MELSVGIDEEHLTLALDGLVCVRRLAHEVRAHDEDARRDACTVEQVLRQSDDGFDEILF